MGGMGVTLDQECTTADEDARSDSDEEGESPRDSGVDGHRRTDGDVRDVDKPKKTV